MTKPEPYLFHVFLLLCFMFLSSFLFPKHHAAGLRAACSLHSTTAVCVVQRACGFGQPGCSRGAVCLLRVLWAQQVGSHSLWPGGRAGRAAVLPQHSALWKPSGPCAVTQPHTIPYLHATLVDRVEEEQLAVRAEVSVLLEEMVSHVQQLLFLQRICLV